MRGGKPGQAHTGDLGFSVSGLDAVATLLLPIVIGNKQLQQTSVSGLANLPLQFAALILVNQNSITIIINFFIVLSPL
jgi:hypothetical protein